MTTEQISWVSLSEASEQINGSGLQGEITCSYQHLVNLFGPPMIDVDHHKTSAEWHISLTHDNVCQGVVSIYDYKQHTSYCARTGVPTEQIDRWHVGGKHEWLCDKLINWV